MVVFLIYMTATATVEGEEIFPHSLPLHRGIAAKLAAMPR